MRRKFIKIFLLILILFTIPKVQAIGSLQENNFVEIEKNGVANFRILFWNTENISYPVKLEVKKKPENFFVLIQPDEFILHPSPKGPPYEKGEYVSLPSGDLLAFPVNIYVKDFGENNEQEVLISALIGSEKDHLTFLMEKTFKFRVKINSSLDREKMNESESIFVPANISSSEKKPIDLKLLPHTFLILVFIVISILVYKYV